MDDKNQSMNEPSEDAAETAHFNSCVRGFLEYGQWIAPEFERRMQHRAKLSPKHLTMLGGSEILTKRHQDAMNCLTLNSEFLARSVQHQITHSMQDDWSRQHARTHNHGHSHAQSHGHGHSHGGGGGGGDGDCSNCTSSQPNKADDHTKWRLAPERSMVKVQSTLKQCVRDWSSLGKAERDSCYTPLVEALTEHLPVVNDKNFGLQKVLVPGSGLGRLVFDLAVLGYDTQGNEFSYQMLLMGDYIMNRSTGKECHTVYPWLGESNNMMQRSEEFASVTFPDIHPSEKVRNAPGQVQMSVAAGEFLMCYDNSANVGAWDAVATCFFIDTAPNVIEYVETIWKMLKSGGIWTNIGPLEYHWMTFRDGDIYENDPRYLESVEFSYDDIKTVMLSCGFEFLKEERRECLYCSRPNAMKKTTFDCVHFTVRKK